MTTDNDKQYVSDAYREVANETTPAALDRRILDLAARESRSSYGLVRAWIRPAAWAATIALSLAILLEMTWFIDVGVEPQPAAAPALEERARRDADVMKAKKTNSRRTGLPGRCKLAWLGTRNRRCRRMPRALPPQNRFPRSPRYDKRPRH